jgi:deoxyribodipyrimidine photo-lyase
MSNLPSPVILWLRRDLRLADQPALAAAIASGSPVIPLYILDDEAPRHHKMGRASRWWLHHSLKSLDKDLRKLGSRLILRRGDAISAMNQIAQETKASAVYCNYHHEPWWRNVERSLKDGLPDGCTLERSHGIYLLPPGTAKTGSGGAFKIYTPFWRALSQHMPPPAPLPAPSAIKAPGNWPDSEDLGEWSLLPAKPDWAGGMAAMWSPGETGAHARLEAFSGKARDYDERRNFPSIAGTSFLSPHLHFGEISPAACWHATMNKGGSSEVFRKEIVWREYAMNIIRQFPEYATHNAREDFDALPWRDAALPAVKADLRAWQQGQTGYPIVDAGMRQLWATGWMHNRVRMITASFLIKHLLIDWRAGEQWFWDTLVDADFASNAVNWQWTAGTGVDSNMFVRIMAPLSQSEKFDAADYIKRWVPELESLSEPYIHDPEEHGVRPADYPPKIIGHRDARERALAAHSTMKKQK